MIICLNCKSEDMQIKYRCMIDPANDTFICKSCGNIQLRYSGTKYETPQELRKRKTNAA
jgi:hypothetical protein